MIGWLIYGLGCLVSLIIQIVLYKKHWDELDNECRILTLILWLPFTTAISWIGVLLFFTSEMLYHGNDDLEF